jgi:hypothetical protein
MAVKDAKLLGRKVEVVELKVDSKSALALAKNPVFHEKETHPYQVPLHQRLLGG